MSRITPRDFDPSTGIQKPTKAPKRPRKGMRRKSPKKVAHEASEEGKAGLAYMLCVKQLRCCACGAPPPSDAHHCKDLPPFDTDDAPYEKSPRKHRRSGARDTIPLCKYGCHNFGPNSFHAGRDNFHALHGPDYGFIPATRASVDAMLGEVDF